MNQRGFIPVFVLIGLLILTGAGVAGTLYLSKTPPGATPSNITSSASDSGKVNSQNSAQPMSVFQILLNRGKTIQPSPAATASGHKTSNPSPTVRSVNTTPPAQTSVPTHAPTPVPTVAAQKNTCDINVVNGKLDGSASDPLLVTIAYSFNTHNGSYMTGAQWDFDGNGTWDTDLKQSNGTMEHTYSSSGTYTPRLQLQASDGSMTDVCSKSFTVSSGIIVKLTGKVYSDVNCNNIPEPDEKGVAGATVLIMKMPEYSIYATLTSDGSGNYNFSQNIQPSAYLSLSPSFGPVPSGYKANPKFSEHTFALNSTQSSINVDIPLVPNENVGACQ